MERTLTFSEVLRAGVSRANRWHGGDLNNWSITDWSNALAGEAGEVCNAVKKLRRLQDGISNRSADRQIGDQREARMHIGVECADVFLYLVLVAHVAGVDLARAVIDKFNRTSIANEFPERLHGTPVAAFGGVADIAAERQRQITIGYEITDDARYTDGELARAGAAYAILAAIELDGSAGPVRHAIRDLAASLWPWADGDFKNKGPRRNLERAGALLAAQLDQLAANIPSAGWEVGIGTIEEPAIERPDWPDIYKNTAHQPTGREQDLIPVTRETLRCAAAALRAMNADDYYENNGAAEREVAAALGEPGSAA